MKSAISRMALVLSMICIIAFASPLTLFATSLDDLSSGSTVNDNQNSTETDNGYSSSRNEADTGAVSDYLKGYTPVTQENMQSANTMASPIVNVIGTATGFILMIASAGIFLVTALDLIYIGLPFTRSFLNPKYGMQNAAGGMGMGMGGMGMRGMGMGMRGGMGMGMGGGAGAPQQATETGLRRQWVSDEAEYCVNFANQQDASTNMAGGAMQGGMGMMGGMGMGAMGGAMPQQAPNPPSTKSIIFMYLKKRMFFIIIFSLSTVILTSSVLTDCGLNLAELLEKIFVKVNGQISNVSIQ